VASGSHFAARSLVGQTSKLPCDALAGLMPALVTRGGAQLLCAAALIYAAPGLHAPGMRAHLRPARVHGGRAWPVLSVPGTSADVEGSEERDLPADGSHERTLARLAMLGSAVSYGAYAPAIKSVYLLPGPPSAPMVSAVRGVMIALPLLPRIFDKDEEGVLLLNGRCLRAAAELTLWSTILSVLLNLGLAEGGSATKSAFLLQAAVICTPVISKIAGDEVEGKTWAGAVTALVGVLVIALDSAGGISAGGLGALFGHMEHADIFFLGCAISWSMTIFRLGRFARVKELSENVVQIQAAKNVFLMLIFGAWLGFDVLTTGRGLEAQWVGYENGFAWLMLFLSAMFGGLVGELFQALGGRSMPAAEANVILTSEPLWAAGLTSFFLGERLGVGVYLGL